MPGFRIKTTKHHSAKSSSLRESRDVYLTRDHSPSLFSNSSVACGPGWATAVAALSTSFAQKLVSSRSLPLPFKKAIRTTSSSLKKLPIIQVSAAKMTWAAGRHEINRDWQGILRSDELS